MDRTNEVKEGDLPTMVFKNKKEYKEMYQKKIEKN